MVMPEYKRVNVFAPHCPVCKQQLSGNNSIMFPYKCECGTWDSDFTKPYDFTIRKELEND